MVGRAAENKGLALFPRRIRGRFAAMCRSDRESNSIAYSDHPYEWTDSVRCQRPVRAWEALQLGNCGPPIETEAGWLVLTHGVGPMRTYCIGAILLDLDDPSKIIGRLSSPLIQTGTDDWSGYVPSVIYTCGGLVHRGRLLLPYAKNDRVTTIATIEIARVLSAIKRE